MQESIMLRDFHVVSVPLITYTPTQHSIPCKCMFVQCTVCGEYTNSVQQALQGVYYCTGECAVCTRERQQSIVEEETERLRKIQRGQIHCTEFTVYCFQQLHCVFSFSAAAENTVQCCRMHCKFSFLSAAMALEWHDGIISECSHPVAPLLLNYVTMLISLIFTTII